MWILILWEERKGSKRFAVYFSIAWFAFTMKKEKKYSKEDFKGWNNQSY